MSRGMRLVRVTVLALLATVAGAQVLVTALPLNPTSLDPHRAIEGYSFMVTNQLYDTLVRLGDDGTIEPGLAVAWSRPEPTVLRLELRRGVRFHDGRPLDATAVAASLRRLADPATGARAAFLVATIDAIVVVDDHTLDLVSDPPFVPLLANLTFPATAIVPPGAGTELGRAPVGTGPFRFVAWREGEVVEIAADPDYWGGAPALAGVRYRVIPEAAARLIAFRAGDLQLIHDLAADAFLALEGEPGVELGRYPSDRTTYLGMNVEHPVLGDPRVRNAIAYALDRQLLVDALFSGLALPPVGPLAPLVRYALDAPDDRPYDPARARALLREAGAEGARLVLHMATDGGLEDVAQYVQAALAEVGLRVELRIHEFATHLEIIRSTTRSSSSGSGGRTPSIRTSCSPWRCTAARSAATTPAATPATRSTHSWRSAPPPRTARSGPPRTARRRSWRWPTCRCCRSTTTWGPTRSAAAWRASACRARRSNSTCGAQGST